MGLVVLLPTRTLPGLAWLLGCVLYAVSHERVKVGRENLVLGLGWAAGDPRVERTLRRSFAHFILVALELVHLKKALRRRTPREILDIRGFEHLERVRESGRGAILVTGHLGNWEVCGALGSSLSMDALAIGRGVENPRIDALLQELRCRFGQRVLAKHGGMLGVARELRRNGMVSMLLDQHAGRGGIRVPFLGRLASTHPTAAALARRFQVPMLPITSYRSGRPFCIHVDVGAPIEADPSLGEEEDRFRMTALYARALEQAIRERPEQWLWFHRRWRQGGSEPESAWVKRYAAAP